MDSTSAVNRAQRVSRVCRWTDPQTKLSPRPFLEQIACSWRIICFSCASFLIRTSHCWILWHFLPVIKWRVSNRVWCHDNTRFSENTIVDKTSVRSMCGVRIQRSDCVLYNWAVSVCGQIGKKTTNEEGTMLVYNVYVMHIVSRVENWEYLRPYSTADAW